MFQQAPIDGLMENLHKFAYFKTFFHNLLLDVNQKSIQKSKLTVHVQYDTYKQDKDEKGQIKHLFDDSNVCK